MATKMKRKTKRNAVLLRRIADVIERFPGNYYQGSYISDPTEESEYDDADTFPTLKKAVNCGTRCCIAGWAVCLTPKEKRPGGNVQYVAQHLLGLTSEEAAQMFDGYWMSGHEELVPAKLRLIADGGKI